MWWCAITLMMIHHHICDDYLCKCDDNHHNCDDTHNICDDIPSHLWWYAITLMMMCHHECDDNHYICDDCRHICDDSHHKCDDLQHICDDPQHICEDLQHICVYRIQGVKTWDFLCLACLHPLFRSVELDNIVHQLLLHWAQWSERNVDSTSYL